MGVHARTLALLVILGTVGCARHTTCPIYPATSPRPLLWRVSGHGGSVVIQATHQGLGAADVSELAWSELGRAQLYVAEAREPDGERDGGYDWNRVARAPGPSLRAKIGDFAFNRLSFYLDVTQDQLYHLRPWVAFMLLGQDAYPPPKPAMTEALFGQATTLGMPMEFLDTWEEQAAYLDAAITPAKLRAAIEGYDDLGCHLQYRVAAFRAGSEAAFEDKLERGDLPALQRNIRWTRLMRGLLDRGVHAFAALGVGHLVGSDGVLNALARYGYRVERL